MKRWLGTLFLPNNLKLGAVAGSYLGEKFADLLQEGGHFGKMPVRCTAKTVLSLLSRACGGPLRLKRMVAARDVEGIVACLQQVAHNRPRVTAWMVLNFLRKRKIASGPVWELCCICLKTELTFSMP